MRALLNSIFGVRRDKATNPQPAGIWSSGHKRLDPFAPLHHQCTA
jgi:hypothetical protein